MESFEVISADGHVDTQWLPDDIFLAAAPRSLTNRVPRLEEWPDGRVWTLHGKNLQQASNRVIGQVPGEGPDWDRLSATGLYSDAAKGLMRPTTVALRLKDQELDGVAGEVIYGILGLDRFLADDPEALQFCFHT